MPIILQNSEFRNQILNGEDFSLNPSEFYANLVASVGDLVKTEQTIRISWKAETDGVNAFVVQNPPAIFRQAGSWIGDQFTVGDVIEFYDNTGGTPISKFTRNITAIANDTILLDGASFTTELGYYAEAIVYGKTPLQAARFRYGIIGNNENTNFVTKVGGSMVQLFSGDGIVTASPTPVSLTRQPGPTSWHDDGSSSLEYVTMLTQAEDFAQVFKLTHTFRFLPYYLDGYQTNLQTLVPPALFNAGLKYVYEISFSVALNSLNTKTIQVSNTNGLTGWWDINPIGLANQFSINSIGYTDVISAQPTTEIDTQLQTEVTISVASGNSTFDANTPFIVWLSYLPPQSDYQNNFNTIAENFLFDSVYQDTGAVAKAGTIMSDIVGTFINPNEILITFKTDYTTAQQIQATDGDYLVGVTIKTDSLGANENDQVALLSDYNQFDYSTDVENLMFVDLMEFYPHDVDQVSTGFTNYAGWIEDGFLMKSTFKLNIDEPATLKSIKATLSAYNPTTNEQFDLDTYNFDLTGIVTVGNVQNINISGTRGFKLPSGDQFNLASIKKSFQSLEGSINVQEYDMKIAFRANMEEWIAQTDADPVFFDSNEPNNGLNKKFSRYNANGYVQKVIVTGVVEDSNGVETEYIFLSPDLLFRDYDLDGANPPKYLGSITLSDINDNPLNEILNDDITKIKAIFSPSNFITNVTNPWAWLHLYIKDQGNINTLDEFSSIHPSVSNNPLIPLSGETQVKITDTGTNIIVEAMINSINLPDPNAEYTIEARLSDENLVPEGKTMESGDAKTTEDSNLKTLD